MPRRPAQIDAGRSFSEGLFQEGPGSRGPAVPLKQQATAALSRVKLHTARSLFRLKSPEPFEPSSPPYLSLRRMAHTGRQGPPAKPLSRRLSQAKRRANAAERRPSAARFCVTRKEGADPVGVRPFCRFRAYCAVRKGWEKRYFCTFSPNCIRMVAASARVMVPVGTMVLAVRPFIRPTALAQLTASTAQSEMLA